MSAFEGHQAQQQPRLFFLSQHLPAVAAAWVVLQITLCEASQDSGLGVTQFETEPAQESFIDDYPRHKALLGPWSEGSFA